MMATTNISASSVLLVSINRTRKQAYSTTAKASSSSSSEKVEIRVCTDKPCRKQGSSDTLQVLSGIAPSFVTVNSCGCLARCGSGPNIVVLPGPTFVSHCGTPTKAAGVMSVVCGGGVEDNAAGEAAASSVSRCLEALALRKRAEDEMGRGDFSLAYSLLSQAVDLKPFGGLHIIYKDRSAARLAVGDVNGALEDAKQALALARYYPEAYICEGDVFMVMEQFDAAEESYSIALDLDPSIRRSKSFKARIAKLQEKLAPADMA
ncbi:hypothetical protein ACP275_04G185600 [Erythranthe tilingii]